MQIDEAFIQDYVSGRLDAVERAAVEKAARSDAYVALRLEAARAVTRRVQRRLTH
jgi:anti-sigma factor RsiW